MTKDNSKYSESHIVEILIILTTHISFPKNIIDVGANTNASISTPFIKNGWDALLIEPQQSCVDKLLEEFRQFTRVDVICCGCSDAEGISKLYSAKEGDGSEMATFSSSDDPWMLMVRNKEKYTEVKIHRLSDILDSRSRFSEIGILKIDTESFDYKVLMGLDLDRHHPKIIVTEEYLWNIEDVSAKHNLLERAGYVCLGWSSYNTIWVCSHFYEMSWSKVRLWSWLQNVKHLKPPFNSIVGLHQIEDLLNRTPYTDGCLPGVDALLYSRSFRCKPSALMNIPVVIANLGLNTLPSLKKTDGHQQILVSYHLANKDGVILWDGIRTPLNTDIDPLKSEVLLLELIAPSIQGEYIIQLDLVVEGVGWLSSIRGLPASVCKMIVEQIEN